MQVYAHILASRFLFYCQAMQFSVVIHVCSGGFWRKWIRSLGSFKALKYLMKIMPHLYFEAREIFVTVSKKKERANMTNNISSILLLNFSTKWKCASNIAAQIWIFTMGEYNDKCVIRKSVSMLIKDWPLTC